MTADGYSSLLGGFTRRRYGSSSATTSHRLDSVLACCAQRTEDPKVLTTIRILVKVGPGDQGSIRHNR